MAPAASRIFRFASSRSIRFLAAFAVFTISAGIALAAPQRAFDPDRIHGYYKDGDFEKVIRELDGFQKSGRKCLRSDSLFLEKHLAVVYAANPATRELGRYHMHKLLDLFPSADLIDMFVGEEVDGVFDKVRKEHSLSKAAPSASAARSLAVTRTVRPAPAPPARPVPNAAINAVAAAANPAPARPAAPPPAASVAPSPSLTARQKQDRLALARADLSDAAVRDTGSETSWTDAGAWIGGSAALALVAITLYYAGSPKETPSKTYEVAATAAH